MVPLRKLTFERFGLSMVVSYLCASNGAFTVRGAFGGNEWRTLREALAMDLTTATRCALDQLKKETDRPWTTPSMR